MASDTTPPGPARPRALRPRAVLAAWVMTIGVDLFFNAGVFSPLFDQSREPSLLDDATLFRRIPVAYVALALAVVALAWLVDVTGRRDSRTGGALGGLCGVVVAGLGVVALWTAVEITGLFVWSQALVQVSELAAAGAVLGSCAGAADRRALLRTTRRTYAIAVGAVVLAIAAQNVLGTWSPG